MNKTVSINISGIIFHIDEEAFEKLQAYLRKIHIRFSKIEEGQEIIADIEARIAELFTQRLEGRKEVVSQQDVDEIIEIMGEPDEFDDSDPEKEEAADPKKTKRQWKMGRRLYRDGDQRVLGGVASGIAAYFDIDPVIVRIIFLIGFVVPFLLFAYVILWIAVPEAKTTAQKLEMKGERVNISNIEKTINEEFTEVKNNFKNIKKSRPYNHFVDFLDQFFQVIGQILKYLVKAIVLIVGISFVFAGLMIVLALWGSFFPENWFSIGYSNWDLVYFPAFFDLFANPENIHTFLIGVILIVGIPVLALIYGGIKLIFRFRANDRLIGVLGFILWLFSWALVIMPGVFEASHYKEFASTTKVEELSVQSKILYVSAPSDSLNAYYDEGIEYIDMDNVKIINTGKKHELFIVPELDVRESSDHNVLLVEKRKSHGRNRSEAMENAQHVQYEYKLTDSLLILDRYFTLPKGQKFRGQQLDLILRLPVGQIIVFQDGLEEIIWESPSFYDDYYGNDYIGRKFIMTDHGLKSL